MDFGPLVILPSATVRTALEQIDRTGSQLALVVDGGRLVGVVSDGDIRRGLLRGVKLDDPVMSVINEHPATVAPTADQDEVDRLKNELGVRHIPVVDADRGLLDVVGPGERISVELTTPVVLMAGGRGQRLYPLTKDLPKPLVPVGGVPMIEVILRRLRAQGFRTVHVSVNYLGHMIEDHLGDGSALGLHIEYLHESAPLGTAGALAQLSGVVNEPLVVMNSDLLTDVDLRRMLSFHRNLGAAATVGVREYAFEIPFGVIRAESERVTTLAEKPQHRELVNTGIYVLDADVVSLLEPDAYFDMPMLLQLLIDRERAVGAYRIDEDWIDVGRPEDLERARAMVERSGL